ncbi:hypothetical protein T265_02318 [Opisthorchis viverrini]|uniref:Uncharacterized protein n=1 Tax=Opisthorchis viverrini TaxID=6198 RepID=A0A075AIC7_OPIVI|nr:hypothetical protein T265_02318 [Opisthorchis viverrini]KER31404.1 hypothetical protein T265_02318 [Opisthorchis viverrini]
MKPTCPLKSGTTYVVKMDVPALLQPHRVTPGTVESSKLAGSISPRSSPHRITSGDAWRV